MSLSGTRAASRPIRRRPAPARPKSRRQLGADWPGLQANARSAGNAQDMSCTARLRLPTRRPARAHVVSGICADSGHVQSVLSGHLRPRPNLVAALSALMGRQQLLAAQRPRAPEARYDLAKSTTSSTSAFAGIVALQIARAALLVTGWEPPTANPFSLFRPTKIRGGLSY